MILSVILFLHGGPGLNSEMERHILAPELEKQGIHLSTWDEPSRARPENGTFTPDQAFNHSVESARAELKKLATPAAPITLIAHSFGAQIALRLVQSDPDLVKRVIFLAPAFDVTAGFRRLLSLAASDLTDTAPSTAERLKTFASDTSVPLADPAWTEAFNLAFTDPLLLTHYWSSKEAFAACIPHLAKPGYGFDGEAFFAVLAEYARQDVFRLDERAKKVQKILVFGTSDPIAREEDQLAIAPAILGDYSVLRVPGASHYVHLDTAEEFARVLASILGQNSDQGVRAETTNLL